MKVATWNINGLRAAKTSLKDLIATTEADVVCLQETKITKDLLTSDIALLEGYNSYFDFSRKRAGYSGVATFCKNSATPIKAQTGLGNTFEDEAGVDAIKCYGKLESLFTPERIKELDFEGRTVMTQHKIYGEDSSGKTLVIINVYCPRAGDDNDRNEFKLDFYKALEERANALIQDGNFVIVLGDINTSHKLIDHCDPSDPMIFFDNLSRSWLDKFLYEEGDYSDLFSEEEKSSNGNFVDCFRYFYPNKTNMFTCWCTSSRARETNYGTRIDYVFSDTYLTKFLKSCEILPDFQGSDHCPVEACFSRDVVPSKQLPSICTALYTEYGGKQQKLSSYFSSKSHNNDRKRSHAEDNEIMNNKVKTKTSKSSQLKLTSLFTSNPKKAVEKCDKIKNQSVIVSSNVNKQPKNSEASLFWKKVLKGPKPAPLCPGHNEECVLRTVKKEGPNLGRQFYCCSRPEGHKSNPEARCNFFKWC